MKDVAFVLWFLYVTGFTVVFWVTKVGSLAEFLMSIITWLILVSLPPILFPD
tara:strand:+ start:490 stop:645 length:156 start_codon:yes stop_codon:yes gene_type:complete